MALKRVFIKRTIGEWDTIELKVKALGKSNISHYLRSQIPKLKSIMDDCPECITHAKGERKQKGFFITAESYETMIKVSELMGKTVTATIDELLITPLLLEK